MKNISAKLVKILASVETVKKTGYNSHQKYAYATEADIMDSIRGALLEHKVFITESSKVLGVMPVESVDRDGNPKKSFITTVETTHTFIDSESGETLVVTSAGQGHDQQDKGVYKAITGATKYFYLKNFMVSTGDDPENDGTKKGPAVAKPAAPGVYGMPPAAKKPASGFPAPAAKPAPQAAAPKAAAPAPAAKAPAGDKWGFDSAGKKVAPKKQEVVYDDTEESQVEAQDYDSQEEEPSF